jgi:hypothetical protein
MNLNLKRSFAAMFLAALAITLTSIPAFGGPCGGIQVLNCSADTGGITTVVTSEVIERAKNGLDLQTGKPDKHVWEYTSATACQLSTPGGLNADAPCASAVLACAGNTAAQGLGPQIRLYRRELGPNGRPLPSGWVEVGLTCSPESVPGAPVLGMGLILAAFHNTAWALPTVHIQPEGNVTLVTLPTFFKVTWPTAGFQPDEIDTVTLMGKPVQIRPTNEGYTYVFGDDSSPLQTDSAGGDYPNGDITHVYAKAGTYSSHIDITYGGEFSVEGGEWLPIPDTVSIAGPVQLLTVRTAHARLVIK